jgi:hypothetical protein
MGSGKKSNGKRRVSKADGTKKRAKKAMRKSRRADDQVDVADAMRYTMPREGFHRLQGEVQFTDGRKMTIDKVIKDGTTATELQALIAEARADAERNAPPVQKSWQAEFEEIVRAHLRAIYLWFCE